MQAVPVHVHSCTFLAGWTETCVCLRPHHACSLSCTAPVHACKHTCAFMCMPADAFMATAQLGMAQRHTPSHAGLKHRTAWQGTAWHGEASHAITRKA
eukprot:358688-Chlamydomonas_euryale.AAC.4